jgi:hypothetical protein
MDSGGAVQFTIGLVAVDGETAIAGIMYRDDDALTIQVKCFNELPDKIPDNGMCSFRVISQSG